MKEWTKATQWYWFCEEKLPSGKQCKASKFNVQSEKALDEIIKLHMAAAHNVN
jgi:hypothetical protein